MKLCACLLFVLWRTYSSAARTAKMTYVYRIPRMPSFSRLSAAARLGGLGDGTGCAQPWQLRCPPGRQRGPVHPGTSLASHDPLSSSMGRAQLARGNPSSQTDCSAPHRAICCSSAKGSDASCARITRGRLRVTQAAASRNTLELRPPRATRVACTQRSGLGADLCTMTQARMLEP